jgi:hypothetical protein
VALVHPRAHERAPPLDLKDIADQREQADRRERNEPVEPTEPKDRNEPTDPMDRAEPIEPIERTDPLEQIDSTESSDQSDQSDPEPFALAISPSWALVHAMPFCLETAEVPVFVFVTPGRVEPCLGQYAMQSIGLVPAHLQEQGAAAA